MSLRRLLCAALCLWVCSSCTPEQSEKSHALPPAGAEFEPVSEMLGASCGSLDCHGDEARNLRLHHQNGLRLAPEDIVGGDPTTADEHAENFVSAVLLEPELLARVVASGGEDPERLTLVRKAQGSEEHEGGGALTPEARGCLLSWLRGEVDVSACEASHAIPRPEL